MGFGGMFGNSKMENSFGNIFGDIF